MRTVSKTLPARRKEKYNNKDLTCVTKCQSSKTVTRTKVTGISDFSLNLRLRHWYFFNIMSVEQTQNHIFAFQVMN